MRICVLGLPGHTIATVLGLCRLAFPPTVTGHFEAILDDDTATRSFLTTGPADNVLICSHFPAPDLLRWITHTDPIVILILPDLYISIADSAEADINSSGLCLSLLSKSLSCLASVRRVNKFITITGNNIEVELALLARVLHVTCGGADVTVWRAAEKAVIASFCALFPILANEDNRECLLTDVRKSCQGLLEHARYGTGADVEWPSSVFFDATARVRPASAAFELTGPARCLCYGPFLHLPSGVWDAAVYVTIIGKFDETVVRVEVFGKCPIAHTTAKLSGSGVFEVRFGFSIDNAVMPLQVRLFSCHGEIEGRLRFGGVKLRQVGPV